MSGFNIDNIIGYRVNRCAIAMRQNLRSRFLNAGQDITAEQWIILCLLWQKNGMTQSEISQKSVKDKTTVVRLIDSMQQDGYVKRVALVHDRRNKAIHLTRKGEALQDILIPIAKGMLQDALSSVSGEELAVTMNVLRNIEARLAPAKIDNLNGVEED